MQKKRKFPVLYLAPLAFLALVVMFTIGLGRENPDDLPSMLVGQATPPLYLTPLGDLPMVTEADLRKPEVKLVNFWASWCVGCRIEHPVLVEMAKKGGIIYGLDYKDDKGVKYLTDKENPYVKVSQDKKGRTAIDWGVYGIPETFVVDAKGIITHRHIGAITPEVMRDVIMPEMEKAAAGTAFQTPAGES
jgi:cytochrome c biogenesis protein CcmG, thiol:disulfide interchange protein DsbE